MKTSKSDLIPEPDIKIGYNSEIYRLDKSHLCSFYGSLICQYCKALLFSEEHTRNFCCKKGTNF